MVKVNYHMLPASTPHAERISYLEVELALCISLYNLHIVPCDEMELEGYHFTPQVSGVFHPSAPPPLQPCAPPPVSFPSARVRNVNTQSISGSVCNLFVSQAGLSTSATAATVSGMKPCLTR